MLRFLWCPRFMESHLRRTTAQCRGRQCSRGSHVGLCALGPVTLVNRVSFGFGCISCLGQYFVNIALSLIRRGRPFFEELLTGGLWHLYIIDPQAIVCDALNNVYSCLGVSLLLLIGDYHHCPRVQ